jgi:uncharacterized membrane protein YgcG
MGFFLSIGLLQWLASILGRTKTWWLGGVLGALVGLAVMFFSVIIGVILMAILTPLGLLFDYAVSRAYQERKRQRHSDNAVPIPWWAGGYWAPGGNFGGSGGGDFGGFGGGESGGGGADGGW